MRKIINFSHAATLDGYIDNPQDWWLPYIRLIALFKGVAHRD